MKAKARKARCVPIRAGGCVCARAHACIHAQGCMCSGAIRAAQQMWSLGEIISVPKWKHKNPVKFIKVFSCEELITI